MNIKTVHDFIQALRAGKYAWPGCYPTFFITSDCAALSYDTARRNVGLIARAIRDDDRGGWKIVGHDVNWEDPELYCDHSGKRIESAYAEPETIEVQP